MSFRERRIVWGIVALLALTLVVLLVVVLWPNEKAAAPLYVSPTGTDSGSCSSSAPCRSFKYAFQNGAGRQVVVNGGDYPPQTIPAVSGRSESSRVTFTTNGTVRVGCNQGSTVGNGSQPGFNCVGIYGSFVTFDGGQNKDFRTPTYRVNGFDYQGRWDTERGCGGVVLTNMDIGAFTDACSGGMTVSYSDLGPSVDPLNILVVEDGLNARIEHNLIHDFVIENGGHFECMYWKGVTHPQLLENEFRSCAVYGIHSKEGTSFSSKDAVLDGNYFWNPRGLTTQADIQLTESALPCTNSTVVNNATSEGIINECDPYTQHSNTTHDPNDAPDTIPPEPPVTSTGTTTTTPTTPTNPEYAPACKPDCDEQIADQQQQLNDWNHWYGTAPGK